ncbi:hypothetical protein CTI12_AA080580 [Artemisia annua]|uniref:Helitron helicase-like domain-containing protein n=1 Tax=Artemisia annua TaxID=35608 RepID=A0A2U1Q359_ARTAN|nr:hypothetical protein CTI12_AA080580 [Artemisia annua]
MVLVDREGFKKARYPNVASPVAVVREPGLVEGVPLGHVHDHSGPDVSDSLQVSDSLDVASGGGVIDCGVLKRKVSCVTLDVASPGKNPCKRACTEGMGTSAFDHPDSVCVVTPTCSAPYVPTTAVPMSTTFPQVGTSLPNTGGSPAVHNVGTSRGPVVLDFESGTVRESLQEASEVSAGVQRRPTVASTSAGEANDPNIFVGSGAHGEAQNFTSRGVHGTPVDAGIPVVRGPPQEYRRFGPCNRVCRHCKAIFWDEEKLASSSIRRGAIYHRCCLEGRVKLFTIREYPPLIQQLFSNAHFLDHIRAYNQMFGMTSLGAQIDESVNVGRGPYVFKVSGQIYHQIGRLCPVFGQTPRPDIVQSLITFLDENNAMVQLFRTARDKWLSMTYRLLNYGCSVWERRPSMSYRKLMQLAL